MTAQNASQVANLAAQALASPTADVQRRLARVRRLALVMDRALRVPGTRLHIGLDGLAGIIPGAGDLATGLVSAYIIYEARKMGAPRGLLLRMLMNVGVDVVLGSVPVVGDAFDVIWKANWKNLGLLERYLSRTGVILEGRKP